MRPGTPPPTRWRPSSTGSSPRAARRGSRCGGRTASSARSCQSGARRRRRYCREHGLAFRVDSSNADTKRGLIRDEILPLLRRLHPGAEREPPRARRRARRGCRGRSSARSPSSSRRPRARSRPISAAASAPCASTTCCASRGRCASAPGGSRATSPASSSGPAGRATGSPDGRKKVQDVFVDAKVPRAERDAWPRRRRRRRGRGRPGDRRGAWLGRQPSAHGKM